MHRNKALTQLAPDDFLLVPPKHLGVFFCAETFEFVLPAHTRRAAERIARWHGCRFRYHPATGWGSFEKRGRLPALACTLVESAVQRMEHLRLGRAHPVSGTPA